MSTGRSPWLSRGITMAKRVGLIYSPTGAGKSSLFGTFARGLHAATGKRSRVYTADGGAWLDQDLVDAGIVEIWDLNGATYPFERLREITEGAWPVDPNDPDSPIMPAFSAVKYLATCLGCGKVLHDAPKLPATPVIECKDCKRPVPLKIARKLNEANGIQNIGACFYEGLTAFSDKLMDNMSARSARGERIGEDVAVRFRDGSEDVAGASRSSYGIAQRRPKTAVENTRMLPCDYVWWSARLNRGTDDERRVPVFGPKVAGNAATDEIPAWFGVTLALTVAPTGTGPERRIYLNNFFQTWNKAIADVENLANARIPPHRLAGKFTMSGKEYPNVPEYVVYDARNATMLWDVMQMIEQHQSPVPVSAPAAQPGASTQPVQMQK